MQDFFSLWCFSNCNCLYFLINLISCPLTSAWICYVSLQSEYPKYTPLLATILEGLVSRSNVKDKINHDEEVLDSVTSQSHPCYLNYLSNGLNPNGLIWKIYPIEVCAVVNKLKIWLQFSGDWCCQWVDWQYWQRRAGKIFCTKKWSWRGRSRGSQSCLQ